MALSRGSPHFNPVIPIIGAISLVPAKNRQVVTWAEIAPLNPVFGCLHPTPASVWKQGETLTTAAGDVCRPRAWVFYRHPQAPHPTVVGRISQIWMPSDINEYSNARIIIHHFPMHATLHPIFEMPFLSAPQGPAVHILPPAVSFSKLSSDIHAYDKGHPI